MVYFYQRFVTAFITPYRLFVVGWLGCDRLRTSNETLSPPHGLTDDKKDHLVFSLIPVLWNLWVYKMPVGESASISARTLRY